jgi:hypothetical protein
VITLLVPQTVVLFFVTPNALAILGTGFIIIDAILVWTAVRIFDREQLLKGR